MTDFVLLESEGLLPSFRVGKELQGVPSPELKMEQVWGLEGQLR